MTVWYKPLILTKNRKARVEFVKKYRYQSKEFWSDETKIFIKVIERQKSGEEKAQQILLKIPFVC